MRSMTVFNYLLEATVFGSVLILLLVTVRALLRERLGSRAIYGAWALVGLRLLTPLSFPNPAMDEFRPGFSTDVGARPVADQVRQRIIDAGHALGDLIPGDGNAVALLTARLRSGASGRWYLLAWGLIAVAVGVGLWVQYARKAQMVRRSRVRMLEGEELELLDTLCQRYGLRKAPRVYFAQRLGAGCVVGVWEPYIVLPLDLPREHLAMSLSHQLCHYRARDPFWGLVRGVCCAVHWFNPLVWMAAWLCYRDSEMACDDRVTAKLHDLDRLAYANVIVSTSERESAISMGASFTGKHLRQRVTAVIRCVRGSRIGIAIGSLLAAVVLFFSFATGESEPLPTVQAVPAVSWSAAAVPIGGDMEAIACARRFLESAFVAQDTASCSFTVRSDGAQWNIQALFDPAARPLALRYSRDGYLLEYDGTAYLDGVHFLDASYTHRTLTESVEAYLAAFMNASVPGMRYAAARIETDARSGEVRLLDILLQDAQGQAVCLVEMQVEPLVRIIYCRPLFEEEANG